MWLFEHGTRTAPRRNSFYLLIVVLSLFVLSPLPSSVDLNNEEDDDEELSETLKRQAKGRAAVVIIRVIDDDDNDNNNDDTTTKYLVQRKSKDYPIKSFQNAICLFGGNAKTSDREPKETLIRELEEELPKSLVDLIINSSSLKYHSTTLNSQSAQLIHKNESYTFLCACYEVTITLKQFLKTTTSSSNNFNTNEGTHALLTKEQLLSQNEQKYAWGYDYIMSWYFNENVSNFCNGVSVKKVSNETILQKWTPPV